MILERRSLEGFSCHVNGFLVYQFPHLGIQGRAYQPIFSFSSSSFFPLLKLISAAARCSWSRAWIASPSLPWLKSLLSYDYQGYRKMCGKKSCFLSAFFNSKGKVPSFYLPANSLAFLSNCAGIGILMNGLESLCEQGMSILSSACTLLSAFFISWDFCFSYRYHYLIKFQAY